MNFSANFSKRTRSRIALAPLAALGAGLAATAIAADAAGPSGSERWALRPVRAPEPAPAPVLRGPRSIPLSDLPGERRTVRIVYQGYGAAGAALPTR